MKDSSNGWTAVLKSDRGGVAGPERGKERSRIDTQVVEMMDEWCASMVWYRERWLGGWVAEVMEQWSSVVGAWVVQRQRSGWDSPRRTARDPLVRYGGPPLSPSTCPVLLLCSSSPLSVVYADLQTHRSVTSWVFSSSLLLLLLLLPMFQRERRSRRRWQAQLTRPLPLLPQARHG